MIVVIGVITVAHENRKAEKELKRLRGEPDDEDSNKHLRLYAFLGISLVVGIALFCFFLSQIHEPTPTRRPLTPEEIRVEDSLRQAYRRERDSIEKAQKAEHEEYVRKMARDIVNSGRRERSRDNMRGWDPASEDDLDDNGMDRYSNANDDEGWN